MAQAIKKLAARDMALQSLQDRQGMVSQHLERLLEQQEPSPAEAALAMELAHGVVRRQRTLDAFLDAYRDRPGQLPGGLRHILHLGLYQILFLDRIPDFAAVDQAVRQCRRKFPAQSGFVNAVLRNVAREVGEAHEGTVPLADNVVPLGLFRYRLSERAVFASPQEEPVRFLAEACSLPDDLAGRWLKRMKSLEETFVLGMHMNLRPPIIARVNLWRTTVPIVLESLKSEGAEAVAHDNGRSIVFVGHVNVAALKAFQEGLITPQDASATAVCLQLDLRPGLRVLDLCASPGTKTTHIGELMEGQGEIVAVDVNPEKLERIEQAARRCRLGIVRTMPAADVAHLEPNSFDRVLVDAPCSNTGVLSRRIEARWRFQESHLRRLAQDQRHILTLGASLLKGSGKLVYSTCSLEAEENEMLVKSFTRQRYKLVRQQVSMPSGDEDHPEKRQDGGFWAVIVP